MNRPNTFLIHTENDRRLELGIDQNSNLYVNGKKIITQKTVKLRLFELALLTITTIAVVVQTIMSLICCKF